MTPADLIPDGISLQMLFLVLAAAGTFFGIVAVSVPLIERRPNGRRMKALQQRRTDLLTETRKPKKRGLSASYVGIANHVVGKFKLLGSDHAAEAQKKLLRAGIRSKDAVTIFLFIKLCLPLTLGGIAIILMFGTNLYQMHDLGKAAICAVAILFGLYLPDIITKNKADKRKHALTRGLPDALDLLVICAEAGLNLDSALVRVANEIRLANPELADELELTSIELGFLSERREALQNLEMRTGLKSVSALVGTLAQTEKYGTPLAQSLRVLAAEMRDERLMKAEEKAARLPATLTVPMVLFIMPALFIVLIGPGILRTVDALSNL